MSVVKKCDRCFDTYNHYSKKINGDSINGVAVINMNSISTGYSTPNAYDLCPKCLGEFKEFMSFKTVITSEIKKEKENESISE